MKERLVVNVIVKSEYVIPKYLKKTFERTLVKSFKAKTGFYNFIGKEVSSNTLYKSSRELAILNPDNSVIAITYTEENNLFVETGNQSNRYRSMELIEEINNMDVITVQLNIQEENVNTKFFNVRESYKPMAEILVLATLHSLPELKVKRRVKEIKQAN